MAQFGASGTLELEEVNGYDAAFDDIGPVPVEIDPVMAGTVEPAVDPVPPTGGGLGGGLNLGEMADPAAQAALDEERNDLLEDVVDELQQGGGVMAAGGGGGGGSSFSIIPPAGGSAAGSFFGTGGGGLAGSLLGGGAGIVAGGLGAAAGIVGGAHYAMGQGWLGQAGKDTLGARTNFQGIEGIQNAMDDPLGAIGTGIKTTLDPTGLGETFARSAATELMSQTTMDEQLVSGMQRGVDVWQQELSQIPDPFAGAEWPDAPDPLAGIDWPQPPDPFAGINWPEPPEPDWLSDLQNLLGGGTQSTPTPTERQARMFDGSGQPARDTGLPTWAGPAIDVQGLMERVEQLERALSGSP